MPTLSPTITPFLWFNNKAEEAMNFYCSIFPDAKRGSVTGDGNQVFSVMFTLQGQEFQGFNGGPNFEFTPAISFVVSCASQKEVDYYWGRLLEGGTPSQCGWLKDQFGLSWQIVPEGMAQLIAGPDRAGAARALKAMMGMVKLDLPTMKRAYDGN